jgi:hypothetical protein
VEFDHELARAAERLVTEYEGRLPITTVIRVLSEVAHAHPGSCAERIEVAARERLQAIGPDSARTDPRVE